MYMAEKVCDECHLRFNDNAELGVHLRKYHNNFFCAPCKKEFESHEELDKHLKNTHGLTSTTST